MEGTPYGLQYDLLDEPREEESHACAFSCLPCPWSRRRRGPEQASLLRGEEPHRRETWWVEKARRARECLASSPGRAKGLLCSLGGHGGAKTRRKPLFQYDPVSYALNFDGGPGRGEAERAFVASSAPPPAVPDKTSCV